MKKLNDFKVILRFQVKIKRNHLLFSSLVIKKIKNHSSFYDFITKNSESSYYLSLFNY